MHKLYKRHFFQQEKEAAREKYSGIPIVLTDLFHGRDIESGRFLQRLFSVFGLALYT